MIYHARDWPEGVLCEGCEMPFREGDAMALYPLGMEGNGVPILEGRCPRCVLRASGRRCAGAYAGRIPNRLPVRGCDEVDRMETVGEVPISLAGISDALAVPRDESPPKVSPNSGVPIDVEPQVRRPHVPDGSQPRDRNWRHVAKDTPYAAICRALVRARAWAKRASITRSA
jgi:hypothetical protein